jgi:hypothetical protein
MFDHIIYMYCTCVPLREDQYDVLTVCDWGQKLSYYYLNGKQVTWMM